jgi:hypothetical protein
MAKASYTPLPPIERLRELLDYDPEMGVLRWKERVSPAGRRLAVSGKNAGTYYKKKSARGSNGYLVVIISRRPCRAARVAWALFYGIDPKEGCIWHKDGNVFNLKIENLEKITPGEVGARSGAKKAGKLLGTAGAKSTSGVVGVSFHKGNNRWTAKIGKSTHLGSFATKEEAIAARKKAEVELLN